MPNSIIVENSVTFYILNEIYMCARIERNQKIKKKKIEWNLNVDDVTAILR